ncbi:MAG: hypothetical protein DBX59_03185 [Bacillota bacterium]|nr:MAG: hypothetical protein DBX59_03185 [Bacillota bacterium]
MQWKDYIRLGRISIKSRKKSTRNTVRGIAFGLIMLVPVLFFTLAFNIGLVGAFNATRETSCFLVETVGRESTEGAIAEKPSSDRVLLGRAEYNRLYAEVGKTVEEIIYNEYYSISDTGSSFEGDDSYAVLGNVRSPIFISPNHSETGYVYLNTLVKIVESERAGENIVPAGIRSDLEKKGKRFFLAGKGFSEDARGEVLISETVAKRMECTPEEAVGKPFSVFVRMGDGFLEIVGEFTVAGVISEDYYLLGNKRGADQDAHVWLSGDSVYEEVDGVYKTKYLPQIIREIKLNPDGREDISYRWEYPRDIDELAAEAKAEGFFFPCGVSFFCYNSSNDVLKPNAVLTVQCKNYKSASQVGEMLNRGYKKLHNEFFLLADYSTYFAGDAYANLTMLHRIAQYLMVVLYTFGGIVFFATLLNLYNSVHYSVQVRRNYLGMMRAIGARNVLLPRLYLVEILLIFARSFPWVLVIGGGLSYGIKAAVDYAFYGNTALFGGVLRLNFAYFFLSLAVMLAVVFFIAWLFSRIACIPVTKKRILEVLSDEK